MTTIDHQQQLAMLHSLGEPARLLISRFFASVRERVAKIENAHRHGDYQEVGQLAHSLKGASGSYGATALAELAAKLEAATSPSVPATPASIEPLIAALAPLAQASISESSELLAREVAR
jgi:HPt (histidine-containing phosphotransfer) domain-containing protein